MATSKHQSVAQLVKMYLALFVGHPEAIEVLETVTDKNMDGDCRVVVTVIAHPDDIGHVIGKQGWRAHLIKDMLASLSRAQGDYYDVLDIHQIHDPDSALCKRFCERHKLGRETRAA